MNRENINNKKQKIKMKYLTDFFLKTTNKIKTNTKFQNIKLILVIFQFLSTLALILTVFIIQNNAHNNILKQKKNNSNYYIFYDLSIQQNHNGSNENAAGGYMIRNGFVYNMHNSCIIINACILTANWISSGT